MCVVCLGKQPTRGNGEKQCKAGVNCLPDHAMCHFGTLRVQGKGELQGHRTQVLLWSWRPAEAWTQCLCSQGAGRKAGLLRAGMGRPWLAAKLESSLSSVFAYLLTHKKCKPGRSPRNLTKFSWFISRICIKYVSGVCSVFKQFYHKRVRCSQ